jgi:hypothetical protein
MGIGYDMHLSAALISQSTIARLNQIGFVRDEFVNLTFCHTGEYHATYRGSNPLPDDDLWDNICFLLESDERFSGYLEEEANESVYRRKLLGTGFVMPEFLPPIRLVECPAGVQKLCDIHIGISLSHSAESAIEYLKRLELSSVDKPSPDGIRRVYTLTCESLKDGERLYLWLGQHLSTLPGLRGTIKLEKISKHFRKPENATTLPIATLKAVSQWFAELPSASVSSVFPAKYK